LGYDNQGSASVGERATGSVTSAISTVPPLPTTTAILTILLAVVVLLTVILLTVVLLLAVVLLTIVVLLAIILLTVVLLTVVLLAIVVLLTIVALALVVVVLTPIGRNFEVIATVKRAMLGDAN